MENLKTQEGRMLEINQIEEDFLKTMRANLFDIAPDAVCRIAGKSIELGIKNLDKKYKGFQMAFASDISLYSKNDSSFGRNENEINFGSSGCFTPEVRESYWRTIHAASILKNWKVATEIINTFCEMYRDLEKRIYEANHL